VEMEAVETYLTAYTKVNDSVTFATIPSASSLIAKVPSGISACKPKVFELPEPAFGCFPLKTVKSVDEELKVGELNLDDGDESDEEDEESSSDED